MKEPPFHTYKLVNGEAEMIKSVKVNPDGTRDITYYEWCDVCEESEELCDCGKYDNN